MSALAVLRPERRQGLPVRARPRLSPGAVIGDRYRIDGVLATGATSVVHTAWDPVLRRAVALKVLAPPAPEAPHAQHAEARLAASVDHAALTSVFDAGAHRLLDGTVVDYIVLELAAGGDLRARLLSGPLEWRDAVQVCVDVGEALAGLHARGWLHRDVKPANVLLVDTGTDGLRHGRLADLGIACARGDLRSGALGTAAYASPEQVHGAPASERSDVYALGLVLLEAITGVVEFPGSIDETALARVRHDPMPPATLPPAVAAVVRAMTARRADLRPDAAAATRALRRVLRDDADRSTARSAERAIDRARELDAYDVLGWPPDRAFVAATTIARRLLGAPHACVTVRTGTALSVSSPTRGLDLPVRLPSGGWLDDDGRDGPWAVEDIGAEPWSRDGALLGGIGIRSCAGAPLRSPAGERLATLCVFDDRPRSFDRRALDDLAAVGDLVLHELELRMAARRAALAR